MIDALSHKDEARIKQILNEIRSSSLLQKDEKVIEGCFPIRIKNRKYFCLLTDSRLIITARKGVLVPQQLQIIPLQNIERISVDIYRHPINFILNMVLIPIYILCYAMFWLLEVQILYWICIICLVVLVPYTTYYFIRGEDILRLEIPGKILSLRRTNKYYWFYGKGTLIFYEIDEKTSKIQGKKGDLKDLYALLVSYIKSEI